MHRYKVENLLEKYLGKECSSVVSDMLFVSCLIWDDKCVYESDSINSLCSVCDLKITDKLLVEEYTENYDLRDEIDNLNKENSRLQNNVYSHNNLDKLLKIGKWIGYINLFFQTVTIVNYFIK